MAYFGLKWAILAHFCEKNTDFCEETQKSVRKIKFPWGNLMSYTNFCEQKLVSNTIVLWSTNFCEQKLVRFAIFVSKNYKHFSRWSGTNLKVKSNSSIFYEQSKIALLFCEENRTLLFKEKNQSSCGPALTCGTYNKRSIS